MDREIERFWAIFFDELENNEYFKKEVAPGLMFMCNELESDTIEEQRRE